MSSRPLYVPRYTIEDYRRWSEDRRVVDGVAIAMTPSPFGRSGDFAEDFTRPAGRLRSAQT